MQARALGLEIVPTEEVLRMTEELIEREGSHKAAACAIGVSGSMLSQVIKGKVFPGRKFPEFFGVKVERVFVLIKAKDK